MKRRVFVGTAFAGIAAARPPKAKSGEVPRRPFGKTGEKLSVIGQAGGRLHLAGVEDGAAIVRRALDLGINYFDNARAYWDGRSEEIFGSVLPEFRKQVFLTSKSVQRTRKGAEEDLQKSLKALRTDYLDLWQIHAVDTLDDVNRIFAPGGAIEAFEAAKTAGKCRFIGFTGHRDPAVHLEMLKRYDKYDTILMPLNAADPAYLSFEQQVLPVAVERGLAIQGMKNLANAKLLQELSVRECIGYVLSLPVHCTALCATTVGQLEDDVRVAGAFRRLDDAAMNDLRKRVRRIAGPGLEDWKKKA